MVTNDYLLMCEARRRMTERIDRARQEALVATMRATRPSFRVRLGDWLVRLGSALQGSALRPQPARALGD